MNQSDRNLLLERFARGQESELVGRYIADGPSSLREDLGLEQAEWKVIFDYLVFEHSLIYKAVSQNVEFFTDLYVKHGMAHIREIFDLVDDIYDPMLEQVFDLIAIGNEGLKYHVLEHRERYASVFRLRGGEFVRRVLGLYKDKYEDSWSEVLEILFNIACDKIFSEQTFDHGLKAFSLMMNQVREHRPLVKHKLGKI